MEPVEFGKYLLLKQIGVGRLGQVWKAKVLGVAGLEMPLAVKRLHPHLSTERAVIDIFMKAAAALVHLQHDNIVRVYDFGTAEGTPYLAMELIEGRNVAQLTKALRQRGQVLGIEEALFIVTKACRAVHFATSFESSEVAPGSIIHGGIRPQNVLIDGKGEIKVTDFSISRVLFEGLEDKHGALEKSLPYVAPEVARGEPLGPSFDVFCLGVLLCELVTGRSLVDVSPSELLAKIGSQSWDPREVIPEDLAPSLQEILSKAMAPEPKDRYQGTGQMLVELESYGKEIGAEAEGQSLAGYIESLFGSDLESSEESEAQLEPSGADEAEQAGARQKQAPPLGLLKNKAFIIGGSLAVVLIVLLLVVFWPKGEKSSPPPSVAEKSAQVAEEKTQEKAETLKEGTEASKQSAGQPQAEVAATQEAAEKSGEGAASPATGSSGGPPEVDKFKYRIDEGLQALEQERYKDAIQIFESILKEDPEQKARVAAAYSQALEGLGLTLEDKAPKKAMALLVKATELNPESVEGNFHLGLLYVQTKQYPKAIKRYRKVVELDPQYADAYFNLGYVYAVTKQYGEAEKAYQQVVSLAPPYLDEALFNLAMVQRRLGKKDECIENLKRAVIVNPNNKLAKKYLKKLTGK